MVFNPLFIQNSSSRDSAMLGKAGGLKGKGYLFSDMMQVCLGSQAGASKKLEQFLSANSEINADEANTNLLKLTEGNISSEKDVKFELLLQFLGVSSEELPEQSGLSVEIPAVSSEELKSMLSKITANADNEDELNKVIDEKLLESVEENGENLLVTLQFNNKTIAIDVVPSAEAKSNNSEALSEAGEISGLENSNSVFNMTVSVLPSDVSDSIIAKFVESTHMLKKEAEGTAQISTQEPGKLQLIQNGQTNIAEEKAKLQIDELVNKASDAIPDLAKKVTIYSVVNELSGETENAVQKNVETSFTNPLKQIKLNNQTASLSDAGNSKITDMMNKAGITEQTIKHETQIPKAGSSFMPSNEVNSLETATSGKIINSQVDPASTKNIDFAGKIIKESDVNTNVTKPVVETFSKDSKVISSSPEKTANKETLSAQLLNNLIDDSSTKTDTQNKVSVKINNTQNTVANSEQSAKILNETELEVPSNEKVTISIKKENSSIKVETSAAKPEIAKEVKTTEEPKQTVDKLNVETSTVKPDVTKDAKVVSDANQTSDKIKVETSAAKPEIAKEVKTTEEPKRTVDKPNVENSTVKTEVIKEVKTESLETKATLEKAVKNSDELNQTDIKLNDSKEVKDKTDNNGHQLKSASENNTDTAKDLKPKVNNLTENKNAKETTAKDKTEEIKKENQVKPGEVVTAKTDSENEKPLSQTNTKDGEVLREISGTSRTSSEQRQEQQENNQANNNFLHSINNVENSRNKASFDEAMANNQTPKFVKQSEVVKEVHQFIERKDSTQLVLNVEPADLGKVKVTLEMADKVVKVNVEVESEVIKQALEKSMNDLGQQLSKSGLQLGSVNISLQNADKGNKQHEQTNKRKSNNKTEGGSIVDNETGETQAGKSLGYNTYDYVV